VRYRNLIPLNDTPSTRPFASSRSSFDAREPRRGFSYIPIAPGSAFPALGAGASRSRLGLVTPRRAWVETGDMSSRLASSRFARRFATSRVAVSASSTSLSRSFSSVGDRDVSPLAYELIEPPEGTPEAASAPLALVLHGLMGSGRNWRTFTRALSRRVADEGVPWRFALVDNLWHGNTYGDAKHRAARHPVEGPFLSAKHPNAPCAVDLAADAVAAVAEHIRLTTSSEDASCVPPGFPPAAAVIGHSLGGKIALRVLSKMKNNIPRANRVAAPRAQWWSLDTVPSGVATAQDPHGVRRVIEAVSSLPRVFESREAMRDALAATTHGRRRAFPSDLIDWLGTNLVARDPKLGASSPLNWVFDIGGVAALYDAYERRDDEALAVALEPPENAEVHVVRAARSTRWDDGVVSKLTEKNPSGGAFHTLPNAGHWVHVDNPDGLRALIAPELIRLGNELREYREK